MPDRMEPALRDRRFAGILAAHDQGGGLAAMRMLDDSALDAGFVKRGRLSGVGRTGGSASCRQTSIAGRLTDDPRPLWRPCRDPLPAPAVANR